MWTTSKAWLQDSMSRWTDRRLELWRSSENISHYPSRMTQQLTPRRTPPEIPRKYENPRVYRSRNYKRESHERRIQKRGKMDKTHLTPRTSERVWASYRGTHGSDRSVTYDSLSCTCEFYLRNERWIPLTYSSYSLTRDQCPRDQ